VLGLAVLEPVPELELELVDPEDEEVLLEEDL
jgi:hypothetical protein